MLRNRSYLGEIYYHGKWYPAPHEPLIPTELFEQAQAILKERGEDHAQRYSNASEYLLTGRVRCGRCGQAYIGTAAHGRNGAVHLLHVFHAPPLRHRALRKRPAPRRKARAGRHPPALESAR